MAQNRQFSGEKWNFGTSYEMLAGDIYRDKMGMCTLYLSQPIKITDHFQETIYSELLTNHIYKDSPNLTLEYQTSGNIKKVDQCIVLHEDESLVRITFHENNIFHLTALEDALMRLKSQYENRSQQEDKKQLNAVQQEIHDMLVKELNELKERDKNSRPFFTGVLANPLRKEVEKKYEAKKELLRDAMNLCNGGIFDLETFLNFAKKKEVELYGNEMALKIKLAIGDTPKKQM